MDDLAFILNARVHKASFQSVSILVYRKRADLKQFLDINFIFCIKSIKQDKYIILSIEHNNNKTHLSINNFLFWTA